MNLIFIKEFIKFKREGYEIIGIDESGFANSRKSKFGWILNEEYPNLFANDRIKQVNLILAHDNLRNIHYEILK